MRVTKEMTVPVQAEAEVRNHPKSPRYKHFVICRARAHRHMGTRAHGHTFRWTGRYLRVEKPRELHRKTVPHIIAP